MEAIIIESDRYYEEINQVMLRGADEGGGHREGLGRGGEGASLSWDLLDKKELAMQNLGHRTVRAEEIANTKTS